MISNSCAQLIRTAPSAPLSTAGAASCNPSLSSWPAAVPGSRCRGPAGQAVVGSKLAWLPACVCALAPRHCRQSHKVRLACWAQLPTCLSACFAALKPLASDLRHDCRYHDIGNVGVEHASPAAIRAALAAPRASNPQRQEFTRDHLLRCGLVAELHARVRAGLQGCNASANALPKQAMCVQMTPGNMTAQGVEGGV